MDIKIVYVLKLLALAYVGSLIAVCLTCAQAIFRKFFSKKKFSFLVVALVFIVGFTVVGLFWVPGTNPVDVITVCGKYARTSFCLVIALYLAYWLLSLAKDERWVTVKRAAALPILIGWICVIAMMAFAAVLCWVH